MDDELTGEALRLHLGHCRGCSECERPLTTGEARELVRAVREHDEAEDAAAPA